VAGVGPRDHAQMRSVAPVLADASRADPGPGLAREMWVIG
jgi:hypothetical protein